MIDELVRYGILLDLSHTGYKTANDAMAYMEENYPGIRFVYTHSLPAGLYRNEPNASARGCYRNISDELWKRGYADEDLAKIYGGNKMRVYQQVWEGIPPQQQLEDLEERIRLRNDLRERYISR